MSPRADELLEPFSPVDRVMPRKLDDPELLAFAGKSRGGLYRLIEAGALIPERAPMRGSRCFLTLAAVAAWRASRFTPANEEAAVGKTAAGRRTNNARAETTLAAVARQA